jgi:CubicO group peptidase (beta-lactamase class C family)
VVEAQSAGRLPSVAAAVFSGGEVTWSDAVGLADAENGVEATADTQYAIASITKTFTAASVLQLRDEGKLDLEEPLSVHLPEAAHGTPTLRRLLAHASGLQREPPGEVWENLAFPDEKELLAGLGEAEQVLAPYTAWHYSNLAYALLGHVVGRVSGVPLHRYVEERLLQPLALERTTRVEAPPVAIPYFVEPYSDALRREPGLDMSGSGGEAGLFSTVEDLARWGSFLCDPDASVLAPESVAAMHDVQIMGEPDWTRGAGLGTELWRRGERVFGGHTGGYPGFLSVLVYVRKEKIGAVVFTNGGRWPKLGSMALDLVEAAIDELAPEPEAWSPAEPPPAEILPVLGRWWSEGDEMIFSWRDGKLEARPAAAPEMKDPSVFEQEGEDRFRIVSGRERGELLRVERDERGEVVRLYVATYPFTRTPEIFGAGSASGGASAQRP